MSPEKRSKKGITLVELVISMAFIGFLVITTAILFSISFKGSIQGQGNAVAQKQARAFEIALTDELSKAKKIDATSDEAEGTVFIIDEDGLLYKKKSIAEGVVLDKITGLTFEVSEVKDASNTALRCRINYEITAEDRGVSYSIKGGVICNNIKDDSKILGGKSRVSIPDEFSALVVDLAG